MEVEYNLAHLLSIVGHCRVNSPLATNYIQLLEAFMISAGLSKSPLIETDEISYVNAPWLEITRKFLRSINGKIKIKKVPDLPFLRVSDQNIMKIARDHQFSPKQLNQINQCRSYLQITFLSEMCSTTGHQLIEYYHDPPGNPDITPTTYSKSLMTWPIQANPPTVSWQTWRKLLALLTKPFMKYELKQPLGKWLSTFTSHRVWKFQYKHPFIYDNDNPTDQWQYNTQHLRIQTFIQSPMQNISTDDSPFIPVFPIIHQDHLQLSIQRRTSLHNHDYYISVPPAPIISPVNDYYRRIIPDAFNQLLSAPCNSQHLCERNRTSRQSSSRMDYHNKR